MANIAAINTK